MAAAAAAGSLVAAAAGNFAAVTAGSRIDYHDIVAWQAGSGVVAVAWAVARVWVEQVGKGGSCSSSWSWKPGQG